MFSGFEEKERIVLDDGWEGSTSVVPLLLKGVRLQPLRFASWGNVLEERC